MDTSTMNDEIYHAGPAELRHRASAPLAMPPSVGRASFSPPSALAEAIGLGRPVILCDNEDRENEGDLVFAAQFATPALVNFMIRSCGGLICVALAPRLIERLELRPMVARNDCPRGTAFTASVDAATGIGTGISARDRARTIRLLGNSATRAHDLVKPGHVFPLAAHANGLAARRGHTEAAVALATAAAVALATAAALNPAAAICEILDAEGEPMRRDALIGFGYEHDIPIGTIDALAGWTGQASEWLR